MIGTEEGEAQLGHKHPHSAQRAQATNREDASSLPQGNRGAGGGNAPHCEGRRGTALLRLTGDQEESIRHRFSLFKEMESQRSRKP